MTYQHPDELFILVQEQHQTLLAEAAQLRLWPYSPQAPRYYIPVLRWVGAQLIALGLHLQGYSVQVQQPVVLCCGTLRQQLTSATSTQTNACISLS